MRVGTCRTFDGLCRSQRVWVSACADRHVDGSGILCCVDIVDLREVRVVARLGNGCVGMGWRRRSLLNDRRVVRFVGEKVMMFCGWSSGRMVVNVVGFVVVVVVFVLVGNRKVILWGLCHGVLGRVSRA